jgi:hypothetical protein
MLRLQNKNKIKYIIYLMRVEVNMEKNYIAFNDGRIGYIQNICTCEKCKKRGQAEIFIKDLDDKYLDCIKTNDAQDIIYIGKSLSEAIASLVEHFNKLIDAEKKGNKYLQSVLDFYCNEVIKQ